MKTAWWNQPGTAVNESGWVGLLRKAGTAYLLHWRCAVMSSAGLIHWKRCSSTQQGRRLG